MHDCNVPYAFWEVRCKALWLFQKVSVDWTVSVTTKWCLLACSQGSLRSRLCVMAWNLCIMCPVNHRGEPFYLDAWYKVGWQLGQPTRSWSYTPTKSWIGKTHGSLEALLRVGKMLKMATMLECAASAGGLFEKLTAGWLPYLALDRRWINLPLPRASS